MNMQELNQWIEYGDSDGSDSDSEKENEERQKYGDVEKRKITKAGEIFTGRGLGRGIQTKIFYKKGASQQDKENTMQMARKISRCLFEGKVQIDKEEKVMKIDKKDFEAAGAGKVITFKKLLPRPKKATEAPKARFVGIKKAETNIMTAPKAVAIIQENHNKKQEKRKKQEAKKEIEKKAVRVATTQRRLRSRPIKANPKL